MTGQWRRAVVVWCAVGGLSLFSGCMGADDADVRQWMEAQRQIAPRKPEPVPAPVAFRPEPYGAAELLSPFSDERLARVLRLQADSATARLLDAERNRPREPLEQFPLDAMEMVGILQKGARRVALIRVNGELHQVVVGARLGQNLGRVTRITESEVVLKEIVQDAAGEWVERTASLQLQEAKP
ncbi:pilus assembly protein PilP [Tepidimonas taiwanensis]|nr:pilus assembly protein PilP [Tepidimonas taiwanensis]